jgi:hypothetical protein
MLAGEAVLVVPLGLLYWFGSIRGGSGVALRGRPRLPAGIC